MKTTIKKSWPVALKCIVSAMARAGLVSLPLTVLANPTGGQVTSGNITISQESATKVGITQTTAKGIIDWQRYSIGANEQVQYYQPSATSITLNRVVGQDPSQILGRLTANGQVFLVNPNGIYFGKNAQVDVAGLVASTHNIRNEDFLAGKYNFDIPGKPGASVVNEGTIRIADTGVAAFVAPSVANRGVIAARLGNVALAAANGFTLDFHGDQLLTFLVSDEVAQTAFDIDGKQLTSFVENSGQIEAQGGYVLLTAKAAEKAIHGVINHSGIIEATTVGTRGGEIILHAGRGNLAVSGTLDVSAPHGGDAGFVETSGAEVSIASSTKVNTAAQNGKNGLWLIDPVDITISGGMATAITSALQVGDVTITTSGSNSPSTTSGEATGNGDIFVNSAIGWSTNNFTLFAHRNIYINQNLNGSGSAKLSLQYGQGTADGSNADYTLGRGARVNLPAGQNFSTKQGASGAVSDYVVITSLGVEQDSGTNTLQGMKNNRRGVFYALGSNIDASVTRTWNGGEGWQPIGNWFSEFRGQFAGLGNSVSGLTLNRPSLDYAGFFGGTWFGTTIRDFNLLDANITGMAAGGLIGSAVGTAIKNVHFSGAVNSSSQAGGLVAWAADGTSIYESNSAGTVIGADKVGGLVGHLWGNIDKSSSSSKVIGSGNQVGGLVGYVQYTELVNESYSTGDVVGYDSVGGLIGTFADTEYFFHLVSSYSSGNVNGHSFVGGLVGENRGIISNAYATGRIQATGSNIGGLVGFNSQVVRNSYWDIESSRQSAASSGTGKNTVEMQQRVNYPEWDFANTWEFLSPNSYPTLRKNPEYIAGVAPPAPPVIDVEPVPPPPITVVDPPASPPPVNADTHASTNANILAYITSATGSFEIYRASTEEWVEISNAGGGVVVEVNDFIRASNAILELRFMDGSVMTINSQSIDFSSLQPDSGPSIQTSIAERFIEENNQLWRDRVPAQTGEPAHVNGLVLGVRG